MNRHRYVTSQKYFVLPKNTNFFLKLKYVWGLSNFNRKVKTNNAILFDIFYFLINVSTHQSVMITMMENVIKIRNSIIWKLLQNNESLFFWDSIQHSSSYSVSLLTCFRFVNYESKLLLWWVKLRKCNTIWTYFIRLAKNERQKFVVWEVW